MGRGAHGTVWRAWDPTTKDWVAVKVFSGRGGEEGAWRFMREQRLDIDHPSIIEVLDFGSDSAGSHLVTELLPHGSLQDYVTERGALAPDLVITWGAQLLDAVAAIAAAGVVHRDIKPSNVMLRDEPDGPRAVLVDFGQAWVADGAELTSGQGPVGTRGFTPPEYADPLAPPTPAGDVYALGITLRWAITGGGDGAPETVPADVVELLDRLCASEPRQRPRADDAAEAMRALAAERRAAGLAPGGRAGLPPRVGAPPDPYRRRKVGAGLTFAVVANATALWAINRPDPPPPPQPARAEEIAWVESGGPLAVADDGTIYSASVEQGLVYRHDGTDLVPVAGGGTDTDGRGPAREVDLSSALRLSVVGDPADTYVPGEWELAVAADGALWLNTGELWRIEPGGEATRVLAVEPDPGEQVSPYVVFTRVLTDDGEDEDERSVFDATTRITALPSPMRARGDGIDVVDHTDDRIIHVDADGRISTACDLRATRIAGIEPEGFTTAEEDGTEIATEERSLDPASFVVTEDDECWVVDRATGEIAHVVAGEVQARFFGRPGEIGAPDLADAAPGWTTTATPLESPPDVGTGRTSILGVTGDGTLLIHLAGYTSTGTLGAVEPGSAEPDRTAWFTEADSLDPDLSAPADAGARLVLSPDGTVLAGIFTLLDAPFGADPRTSVPSTSLARFDVDDLFEPSALRLPDAIASASDRTPTYDVAAALAKRTVGDDRDPSIGDRTDGIRFFDISPSKVAATSDRFVASVSQDPWLWSFRARPDDRLAFLALLDAAAGSAPTTCRVQDLTAAPSGQQLAVLCLGDGYSILSVEIGTEAKEDQRPGVLASAAAFDRAAQAWGEANDVEAAGMGPGLRLLYRPDGRLVLASNDEGVIYEVRDGELEPMTDLVRPETDPLDADLDERLTGIEDDPVLVSEAMRRWWADLAGRDDDWCAGPSDQRSDFRWRDVAVVGAEDGGRIVLSTARCLLEVIPGEGTKPFAPGQPSARLTYLAATADALVAYDPVDATIWRYPSDGGERELVAGRSGRLSVSPDGVRAAGSPVGAITNLFVGIDDEACFIEFEAKSIRCVDERGALRTRAGLAVPRP